VNETEIKNRLEGLRAKVNPVFDSAISTVIGRLPEIMSLTKRDSPDECGGEDEREESEDRPTDSREY